MADTDIIDLTAPTPPPEIIVIASDDPDAEPTSTAAPKRSASTSTSRRKLKRSRSGNDAQSTGMVSKGEREREDTGRERKHARDDFPASDLFFVDVTPAAKAKPHLAATASASTLPAVPLINPSTSPIDSKPSLPPLLLPPHVSVFGIDLVEIVDSQRTEGTTKHAINDEDGAEKEKDLEEGEEKDDDDDDEGFIEYLDVDSRRKVPIRSLLPFLPSLKRYLLLILIPALLYLPGPQTILGTTNRPVFFFLYQRGRERE
jgi:hypothetical protein